MAARVNLAGVGCVIIVSLIAGAAVLNVGGAGNTGGAGIGPPVLSDGDMPSAPPAAPARLRAVHYYADRYGQFWIDGSANGTSFRFLVDTGAYGVMFSKRDAGQRLGIDVNRLVFDGMVSTANGTARTASAHVARLTIGPFTATDVSVSIIDGELAEPLLGMAFLRRMSVSISNDMLTLSGAP